MPRSCSSGRFRALSATPRTPVCDATTGRWASDRTSSIVARDAVGEVDDDPPALELRDAAPVRAPSGRPSRCRAPIRRPHCRRSGRGRPSGTRRRRSCRGRPDRRPARGRPRSRAARPRAPDRRPGGRGAPRGPRRNATSVNDPSERFAIASSWRPRWSARALRLRHVFARPAPPQGEQGDVVGAVVVALDVQVPAATSSRPPNTWSATLPSISRGTSTWPRVAAKEQVPAPEQRIRVEVDDRRCRVDVPRSLGHRVRRRGRDRVQPPFRSRDERAPTGTRGDRAGEGRDGRTRRDGSGPGPHVAGSRSRRRTSSSSAIRSVFVNPYRR